MEQPTQPSARPGRLAPDRPEPSPAPPEEAPAPVRPAAVAPDARAVAEPPRLVPDPPAVAPPAARGEPAPPARAGTAGPRGWLGIGALLLVVALLSGLLGGVAAARLASPGDRLPTAPAAAGQAAASLAPGARPTPDQVQAVAASLLPVVVQIEIRDRDGSATGAGVIMRQDGYVLTNRHVIQGARSIQVTLPSAEPLAGRLVGADPENDLAVVKVDRGGLAVARFGRSADLRIGDLTVAVGSPFGFRGTVTSGIVSALHRVVSVPGGHELVDAVQTDAAINPGNSGGALANANGQVVGINSAIATADGASEASAGIGFAIPIDEALAVAELLIAHKPVHVPYLGVETQSDLTPEAVRRYRLGGRTGALVSGVRQASPAARSGLRRGDLIVRLGGATVNGADELKVAVRQAQVGLPVPIAVVRDGTELTRQIVPVDQPRP